MSFKALLVEKDAEGKTSASVQDLAEDRLPEGEVTVAVTGPSSRLTRSMIKRPSWALARNASSSNSGSFISQCASRRITSACGPPPGPRR